MNKWIGIGRLTQDPELKKTNTDLSVCTFDVAIDRRFKDAKGERQTDFIRCVAWRNTADFISKYFMKGKMIALEGSVQVRTWEDSEGKKRYATEILVENAEFCGDSGDKVTRNTNQDTATKEELTQADTKEDSDDDLPW